MERVMDFDSALLRALAHCESYGVDDPFYLYCVLCDFVGADFAGKDAVKMLFAIDKRIQVVKNIKQGGNLACIISKEAYPAFRAQYSQREFCGFIDVLYCILTHTPRKHSKSTKKHITVAKKQYEGKRKAKGRGAPPAPVRPNIYAKVPPNIPPGYCGIWLLYQTIGK